MSLHGGRKYLILDEADYLNPQSTQPALRGMIEEFHKKSRQRTDLMLGDFVEGEDFEINDLEGVELFYE